MRQLVRHHHANLLHTGNSVLVLVLVHQHVGLSECDQTPVLHGARHKVRNCNQVWIQKWNIIFLLMTRLHYCNFNFPFDPL